MVFMDNIEFHDERGDTLLYRYPPDGSGEIKLGGQLTVRTSQKAVFFVEGKVADIFGPGRYTLETKNVPIITKLLSLPWGFKSPFRCEILFLNMKTFTNMKWGTTEPIAFRDRELGMVRLRAFGVYSIRIIDENAFVNNLVGTEGIYTTDEIADFLKTIIISNINLLLGRILTSILDLSVKYEEINNSIVEQVKDDFKRYGLEAVDFYVNSITPPEKVQVMIDERSTIGVLGSKLQEYMQIRTIDALNKAAENQGGSAGAGIGMGAGLGMGMMMPSMIMSNMSGMVKTPPPQPISFYVAINGQQSGPFDINVLKDKVKAGEINQNTYVWKQGMTGWQRAGEVAEISQIFNATSPPPPPLQ